MKTSIKIGRYACKKLDVLIENENMPTQVTTEEDFRALPFKTKIKAIWWLIKVSFWVTVMTAMSLNIKSRWDQILDEQAAS